MTKFNFSDFTHYTNGKPREPEETMSAGDMVAYFSTLPPETPVVAAWEGQIKLFLPKNFELEQAPRWMHEPRPTVVIDVEYD